MFNFSRARSLSVHSYTIFASSPVPSKCRFFQFPSGIEDLLPSFAAPFFSLI